MNFVCIWKPVFLDGVLTNIHNFADVFNKEKVDMLAPHWPYDLKINLEDGVTLKWGPVYSLSSSKLSFLGKFLSKHLSISFILPSHSLHSLPILYVHKKDGWLHLCMDFQDLNKITKKD